MIAAAVLLLLPLQAPPQDAPTGIGDPRTRGGARDLFEDDEGLDPEQRQTRSFTLRPADARALGPLAVAATGRYAAYALERDDGFHVVVVDTASTSLRALGPILPEAPQALSLDDTHLAVALSTELQIVPWSAAESAAEALRRGAPAPQKIALGTGQTTAMVSRSRDGQRALLRQVHDGWRVELVSADGALESVELGVDKASRCTGLSLTAEQLVLTLACQDRDKVTAFRRTGNRGPFESSALGGAPQGGRLTAFTALGSLPITGWDVRGRGLVTLHDANGKVTKRVALEHPPRALRARDALCVVVDNDGGVWLMGLGEGASLIGVDSPSLGERAAAQRPPVIADNGSTVVQADNGPLGADGTAGRPTLWVVPAIN